MHPNGKQDMRFSGAAAALLVGVTLSTQATAGSDHGLPCVAKVLHSEELPFAPIDYWLVNDIAAFDPLAGAPSPTRPDLQTALRPGQSR
jgi:hypothetical protein